MKKSIYIISFIVLGILLQFILHALIEVIALNLLLDSSDVFWDKWYLLHGIFTVLLLVGGIVFGYFQGKKWWQILYVDKKYGEIRF